ncbi:MAG: SRPBCC family protein [Acetobacteraceae bacterium]|nr:SRPBCC family protein [Acetobacteraceae bacterium]
MDDFTARIAIDRSAAEVFGFLADIRNMPRYLPTVTRVGPLGQDRVAVEGEAHGHAYHDEGWLKMEAEAHRMRWGTHADTDYHGELAVREVGGRAEVEVRLHHARRGSDGAGRDIEGALERALGSIKQACEAHAGAAAAKDTTRSADDLPDSRPFGQSATLNPDI